MSFRILQIILGCFLTVLPAVSWAQHAESVPAELAADLIAGPLPPAAALPSALHAMVNELQKGQFSLACRDAASLRSNLMQQAAKLFYGVDRRTGGDVPKIVAFLDKYVRTDKPLLEVPLDLFVPAAPLRAIGADACLRAHQPEVAVLFLAEVAGAAPRDSVTGSRDRLALGVALAAREQRWAAGAAVLTAVDDGPRVLLLRALGSSEPRAQQRHLAMATAMAQSPSDKQLAQRVSQVLAPAPQRTP